MLLRRPRTLLWQLGLVLIAVQTAVAVGLGAYVQHKLREFHYDHTTRELGRIAPVAAGRFEALLAGGRSAECAALARSLGGELGLHVTVMAADGAVLGDSGRPPQELDSQRYRPEVDAAIRTGRGTAVRGGPTAGAEMLHVARLVERDGEILGVVRVSTPLTAVDAELRGLVRALAIGGLLSLAVTIAVIYLVSRNLSETVLRLARGARRFAAGDFRHRIARPASRELALVTDAFNRMAAQLDSQIEQLRAQQREQAAILQSMGSGVVALDAEQRLLRLNRAAEGLLGLDGGAVRGRLLQEVLREPGLHRFVTDAMAGTHRHKGEFTIGRGARRAIEALAEPLQDEAGRTVGLLVLLNDVTQLRRLESIRSDFAANVSHELQTPITAIKGYVETLLEEQSGPEQRRYLKIINRSADRLAAIVEDLLALARLEEPDAARTLERADTAIEPLIRSVISQFEQAASEKAIALACDVPAGLHAVVNAQLVEQAVVNLASNAIKFAEARTTVTLGARRVDGALEITVDDEGPGIPPQHLPRLFERFYRVDRARSRELGGTGLGLAIVKHIAAVHGGRAEAESELGRGSRFRIVLPPGAAG